MNNISRNRVLPQEPCVPIPYKFLTYRLILEQLEELKKEGHDLQDILVVYNGQMGYFFLLHTSKKLRSSADRIFNYQVESNIEYTPPLKNVRPITETANGEERIYYAQEYDGEVERLQYCNKIMCLPSSFFYDQRIPLSQIIDKEKVLSHEDISNVYLIPKEKGVATVWYKNQRFDINLAQLTPEMEDHICEELEGEAQLRGKFVMITEDSFC